METSTQTHFTGIEHRVEQRSNEWYNLRRNVTLTSSQFGDAIGVGKGRPYDFFLSLISDDTMLFENCDSTLSILQQGIDNEIIIREAYAMLMGSVVKESGFWIPEKDSPLKNLIGASPDGVVVDPLDGTRMYGLTEFKAPVYKMYSGDNLLNGIPRHYMAQIQGQMAIIGAGWCDFMAVCFKTREIMLKRVYYSPVYWNHLTAIIIQFCHSLQEARVRTAFSQNPTEGIAAKELKRRGVQRQKFPGENSIVIEDLILHTNQGFCGTSNVFMSFDFLMGYPCNKPTNDRQGHILEQIDHEIKKKCTKRIS